MEEARNAGVADIVDHEVPSESEIDRDMKLLAKQQEQLLSDVKRAYQEEAEREREQHDIEQQEEMEKRLRAMNLEFSPENEAELNKLKNVSIILDVDCRWCHLLSWKYKW